LILDDGRNVLDGAGKIFSGTRGIFDGEQRISRARNTFSRPNEGGETASGVAVHAKTCAKVLQIVKTYNT
jgi:hypothetical protein